MLRKMHPTGCPDSFPMRRSLSGRLATCGLDCQSVPPRVHSDRSGTAYSVPRRPQCFEKCTPVGAASTEPAVPSRAPQASALHTQC